MKQNITLFLMVLVMGAYTHPEAQINNLNTVPTQLIIPIIEADEGGTLVTLGIPTDGIVRPSPMAPPGQDIRLVTVYIPEGYNDTNEQYPVVYYLPGLGGTNESFSVGNKIILDDLIRKKLVVPMIVVHNDPSLLIGVNPDGKQTYQGSWYVNSALNGAFETFMAQNTIDFIDSNFRTKPNSGFRGVIGQSMGGYGSLFLGMRHPDKFIGFGSESGTPFWALATTGLATEPPDQLFTINSLIQPEIPTVGPNAGKINPDNGDFTFSFFSYSAALSPNLDAVAGIPVNPFVDEFFVDLPFKVNGDGTPVFAPGPAMGAKPGNPNEGMPVIFPQTLVLDDTVINRWREKDPFFISNELEVVETLKEQAFYLDGGNKELINARGARMLSAKLAEQGVDHEYVLYKGGHTTCLLDEGMNPCSRNRTLFQMLSAVFSASGECPNKTRTKIVGKGTIIIEDTAQMCIARGTVVGIETLPEQNIIETDITIQLNDSGKLLIGDSNSPGGALQVGNLFSKAKIFGDPKLEDNTIRATFIIDGPQALLQIGEQGFLGFGAGIIGQFPEIPNDWGMSSLTNLDNLEVDIRQGLFEHNQIASGFETCASVFAIGQDSNSTTTTLYTFKINFPDGNMLGGGNLASIPDCWRLQPVNIMEAGKLCPRGIRIDLDTSTDTDDFFYKQQMASTGFYFNNSFRKLLSSAEQLTDRGRSDETFELIDGTFDEFCTFLAAQIYINQGSKEGAIATVDGQNLIAYIDIINTASTIVRTADIPIGVNQELDIAKILKLGAIGIWVENTNNNERELIRVYDVKPVA